MEPYHFVRSKGSTETFHNHIRVLEPYHFVRSKGFFRPKRPRRFRFGTLPFRKVKGLFTKNLQAELSFGTLPFRKVKGHTTITRDLQSCVLEPYHFVRSKGVQCRSEKLRRVLEPYHFVRSKGGKTLPLQIVEGFGTLPFRKVKGRRFRCRKREHMFWNLTIS